MTEPADNRRERREDLSSVINAALPEALDKALPPALAKALPPELERLTWGDMRPTRKWPEIRAYLEHSIEEHETRVRRLEGLRRHAYELGSGIIKDILIHVLVSTTVMGGLIAFAWKVLFHGGTK